MNEQLNEKVKKSILRLQNFYPKEGYYLAFSGGKDSVVCKKLLDLSYCPYDAHYMVTGIDPPELVRFIKEYHKDVKFDYPRYSDGSIVTMWNLILRHHMPPTRTIRFCCRELKEAGGDGRMVVTGVRWEESTNRKNNQGPVTIMSKKKEAQNLAKTDYFEATKKGGIILTNDNEISRRMVENCYKRNKTTVNPIIEWTEKDVWDFIKAYDLPYCSLYDEGWSRLGCIGCPMAGKTLRKKDFERYPKYLNAYLLAFDKTIKDRARLGMPTIAGCETATDLFNWWCEEDITLEQINLFDMEDE